MEQLSKIIKGKFDFLKSYSNSDFNESNLREVSSLLRFLFIDNGGAIQKIKNDLKLEDIKVKLNKNHSSIIPGTFFYQHGGGNKNGKITIQGLQIINRALGPEEIKEMYEKEKELIEEEEFLTIGQYLNIISFKEDGIDVTKEFLILFIANKLGGNHFDERRTHNKIKDEEMMNTLDRIMNKYKVLDENPIFIELMSIGQLLSNDEKLNNFINNLNK